MVPFHRPIPESKPGGKADGVLPAQQAKSGPAGGAGIIGAWVQAEKMIQIALVLPCAGFIGWLIGAWLDHILHQSWIAMVGIVVGIIAGLVGAIQMAMVYSADPKQEGKSGDGTEDGGSGNPL
jgi:ATP synthase protein I